MPWPPKTRLFSSFVSRNRRWLAAAAVAGMIAFSIDCGYLGIDFGFHWDEGLQSAGVHNCVDKLLLLPGIYNYGNLYFLLGLAVVAAHNLRVIPAFLREMAARHDDAISSVESYTSIKQFQKTARAFIDGHQYTIENRMLFFCLSSLATLWIYLTLRKLYPQRYLGALAAAAFVAGSWELQYHARFIAVDALLAQVLALELFLLAGAWRASTPARFLGWYGAAAVGAALAFTCKAPALFILPAVLLLPFLRRQPARRAGQLVVAALGLAVAAGTTLIIQPSFAIDTLRNVTVLARIGEEYAKMVSAHPNSTPGLVARVGAFLAWLWLAVPSPWVSVSVVMSLFTVVGLVLFVKDHRRLSILGGVIVLPILALAVRHALLIVRNYLLLIPFLAAGFGVGLAAIVDRLRGTPIAQRALVAVAAAVFLLQARWLHAAAVDIGHLTLQDITRETAAELLSHPEPLRLSPRVFTELTPRLSAAYACHDPGPAPTDRRVVIHASENEWLSNSFGLFRHMHGARDVNYDWYSTFVGRAERSPILILSAGQARDQKLPVGRYGFCDPVVRAHPGGDAGVTHARDARPDVRAKPERRN